MHLPLTLHLAAVAAVLTFVGCDDGDTNPGSGGVGGAAQCAALGEAQALPAVTRFDIAAASDGYVLVMEAGGFGSESWATWDWSDTPTRVDVGPGRFPVALAGNGSEVVAMGPGMLIEQIQVRRWEGSDWASDAADLSEEFGPTNAFAEAGDIAIGADGTVAVVWMEARNIPDERTSTAWLSLRTAAGEFLPRETVFGLEWDVRGPELHVVLDPEGGVHVLGHAYDGEAVQMVYRHRDPAGVWAEVLTVGPVPGKLANVTISGMVWTEDGGIYVAETHDSSPFEEREGGTVLYRIDGDVVRRVATVEDARAVAVALAMAPLGDRVIIAVSHGENNFEAAESRDSIDVYLCDADGCGRGFEPRTTKGVFYGSLALASRGGEAALVWEQSPKQGVDAPESNFALRFGCD